MANKALMGVAEGFSLRGSVVGIKEFFGDKRFIAGTVLGLSLLAGGYAISDPGSGSSSGSSDPLSQLLSDQESAITDKMKEDAKDCAAGKDGTLGNAINMSLKAHLELASASPNVEQLFDVNAACFAGLSSLIDLSFAIPSLASIIAAAKDAVMQYAKKKICSAVFQVTSMVTGPINQAIGTANQYIGALNGLSASLNNPQNVLTMIDPNLGAAYNPGQSGTYTTGEPFGNKPQTGTGDSSGGSSAGNYAQVQQLTQQLGNLQALIGPTQLALNQAQQDYNSCKAVPGSSDGCVATQSLFQTAQQKLGDLHSQIISTQNQINSLLGAPSSGSGSSSSSGGGGAVFGGTSSGGVQQSMAAPATTVAPAKPQTLTQKLSNLFQ